MLNSRAAECERLIFIAKLPSLCLLRGARLEMRISGGMCGQMICRVPKELRNRQELGRRNKVKGYRAQSDVNLAAMASYDAPDSGNIC
jgi:hypothetical protein